MKNWIVSLVSASLLFISVANTYAVEKCEKVRSKSAAQCSLVKSWMDLHECPNVTQKTIVLTPSCSPGKEFAEGDSATHHYKVRLIKKEIGDAWSSHVEWSTQPKILKTELHPVASVPSPDRAPASIRPNEPTSFGIPQPTPPEAPKETPVKINGFIDAQYQANGGANLNRGFLVNDGALYLTADISDLDFKIDLPFRMYTQGKPDFEFALTKAQAYLGQKYSSGFRWKLGQFDTTYGFEGNDTVDVVFTRQGNVYNFTDPFVHTGLNFGYDFNSEWGLNAYVTNPNDRGILSGNGIQYGLQLVKSSAVFRLAPGFLFNFDSSSQKMNYYLDLVTGITVGNLSMDGEISFNSRNDIINPETNLGTQGLGGLLQILYALNASTNFGTRMEYITNQALNDPKGSPSQNALKSQILIFIGPQYTLTKNIRLKLDYSYQLDTAFITQAQTPYHGLQLAGVLRF